MAHVSVNGPADAYDYESITVSTTALGFTATKITVANTAIGSANPRRAKEVLLTVETNTIRFRLDGTDPTAAEGHLLAVGDSLNIEGEDNIRRFRMIRATADATVKVTYYR
jgi:hypothetical protein